MAYNPDDPSQNRYWNEQVIRSLREQIYEIERRMRTDPDRYDRGRYSNIIRKLNEAIYALEEESQLSVMKETLTEYYHYQAGMAEYAELVILHRTNPEQFDIEYPTRIQSLENHISILEDIGTDVTISEVNAFYQNIKYVKAIREKNTDKIIITNSNHILSISFYTGGDFSSYLINTFSNEKML